MQFTIFINIDPSTYALRIIHAFQLSKHGIACTLDNGKYEQKMYLVFFITTYSWQGSSVCV